MTTVKSHRDLLVWPKAMDLTVEIYRLAGSLPQVETYRLGGQITRAAASVPGNIAEGHARGTRKDYANFLAIAKGSLMETDTFLQLAVRLNFISGEDASTALGLLTEVSKMLSVLRSRLVAGVEGSPKPVTQTPKPQGTYASNIRYR